VLAEGATADVVVLDRAFRVVRTFIAGSEASRTSSLNPLEPSR
jgi:N-acetylglucosamine-6-phosphate deacetylase